MSLWTFGFKSRKGDKVKEMVGDGAAQDAGKHLSVFT
jgi:hypothetical protein